MSTESPSTQILKKKVDKLIENLSIETETYQLHHALDFLSEFYPPSESGSVEGSVNWNSLQNRLKLRDLMEERQLEIHRAHQRSFNQIRESLKKVEDEMNTLKNSCKSMRTRLNRTIDDSGQLLNKSELLYQQSSNLQIQSDIVGSFLNNFQLTDQELMTIQSPTLSLDQNFFSALERVKQIQRDSKQLLIYSEHQRAGLDILENMSEYLENAYKLLYRWIKQECKELEKSTCTDLNPYLPMALASLNERPVLFRYCIEEIADTRAKTIKQFFSLSLTKGSHGSRPIEIWAHDPPRYVTDMAAWLHLQLAEEAEFVQSLLKHIPTGDETQKKKYEENRILILNTSFSEVSTIFSLRAEQAFLPQLAITTTLSVINRLDYYKFQFYKTLGEGSSLILAIDKIKNHCYNLIDTQINSKYEKLYRKSMAIPQDLSPPHEVHETISQMKEVYKIFSESIVPQEEILSKLHQLTDALLIKLVEVCEKSSSSLTKISRSIFLLNCNHALIEIMHPDIFNDSDQPVLQSLISQLQSKIDENLTYLVGLLIDKVEEACGLKCVFLIREYQNSDKDLSLIPGLRPTEVKENLKVFHNQLLDPLGALSMPEASKLSSLAQQQQVQILVKRAILDSYSTLFQTITSSKYISSDNQISTESWFNYKPEAIKSILQLEM